MKQYKMDKVTVAFNRKTMDVGTVDVVRGCTGCELANAPCYSAKMARMHGIDFFDPVNREFDIALINRQLSAYPKPWIRIGCISDPSLDWNKSLAVANMALAYGIKPVIITKHHKHMSLTDIDFLHLYLKNKIQFQISVSGLMSNAVKNNRITFMHFLKDSSVPTIMRINSCAFKPGSRPEKLQKELVDLAIEHKFPLLETPIRLFKTSNIWNLVDQDKYHRHLSPITGKLDSQRTAGLIIKKAEYACYSTCSPVPTEYDPVGCFHQCCTIMR
jgi:hypothetical protein